MAAWAVCRSDFVESVTQDADLNITVLLKSRALAVAEWILTGTLLAVFIVAGFVPAWRTMNTDFPNYFLAAAIHHEGTPIDRAYEWRWFQREKDRQGIDQSLVGFAPHPPLCAAPMLLLASLPSLVAKRVWLVFNLVLLALCIWILSRVTSLPLRRLLLLTFLAILTLRDNFLFGQYYVVILFLICLAYLAHARGHRATSGAVLAVAASLKIFPGFFLILFLRKRNWRAAAGLIVTGIALSVASILLFGWNVHRVLLTEVLSRALHGDIVSPYVLQWNSFTALCHRFFLAEPELNPAPLFNSPTTYAIAQAFISVSLLFSFLFFTGDEETPRASAWEWTAFATLLLLLSSMPTPYHFCLLIFSVIIAVDLLLKDSLEKNRVSYSALALVLLFAITCYPLPSFAWLTLQMRLLATFAFYLGLLCNAPSRAGFATRKIFIALAVILFAGLTLSNLRSLKNRDADYSRRLATPAIGYGTFAALKAGDHLLFDEMVLDHFAAIGLSGNNIQPIPASGDILAIAAGPWSRWVYFELANRTSQIFRLPASEIGQASASPQYVTDGEDPAISPRGDMLAFLRKDKNGARSTLWMMIDSSPVPAHGAENLGNILEMTVLPGGNIMAAVGNAANPRLVCLNNHSGQSRPVIEIVGSVRYPAIAYDGHRLAFSRRESGSWHLFVYDFYRKSEQQLTTGPCNATAPSWEDDQTLLYVTDCGRGLGLSAPARVRIAP